jgi:site-specific DNA-methyltransferase (cytosine-N4-specific)
MQDESRTRPNADRPAKNLLMIPARFAIAMQDAGWILRNDIIWAKPNGMPSSVTDRLSTKHEHLFLFAKKPKYYFDLDAAAEPVVKGSSGSTFDSGKTAEHQLGRAGSAGREESETKNPGDVWRIATSPFPGSHFAVFPPALPERCILAGSRPGDTVLDPFSGSGTTGMVAGKRGRKYVGIDLNPEYHALALKTRLAQGVLT